MLLDRIVGQMNELIINVVHVNWIVCACCPKITFFADKCILVGVDHYKYSDVKLSVIDEERLFNILLDDERIEFQCILLRRLLLRTATIFVFLLSIFLWRIFKFMMIQNWKFPHDIITKEFRWLILVTIILLSFSKISCFKIT